MAVWDDVIPEEDRAVYELAGYGRRQELTGRPALLVVDVNYGFVGETREPILESVRKHRHSCGEAGWRAVDQLQVLLPAARQAGVPIYYTTGFEVRSTDELGRWASKNARAGEDPTEAGRRARRIVEEIAPGPDDVVLYKQKPSAFLGTPLLSMLINDRIETVLVTGCTTSGCVRATVVDAFSYNFRVAVVEECVFDRGVVPHKVNLFDMHQKYADVISLADALQFFERTAGRVSR